MICVVKTFKSQNWKQGNSKRLAVYTSKFESERIKYCYTFSHEKFERPPKDCYQLFIQNKKRYHVATFGYYDLVDEQFSWKNHLSHERLFNLLSQLKLTFGELDQMITLKLQPLIAEIRHEWEHSEEFLVTEELKAVIQKYTLTKAAFEKKWGQNTYDYIYDVFGTLRNKEYLGQIQGKQNFKSHAKKAQQRQASSKSHTEKEWLKIFYRTLAKQFHPDVNGNTEAMALLNKLKNEWGI